MRRVLVVIATAAAVRLGRPTAPRTFLRRQGQCTRRQKAALRELWPRFGVDVAWNGTLTPADLFASRGPCVLDVGFGHGESLAGMAARRPHTNYLGVEVHRPGVAAALIRLAEADASNVKICRIDAVALLETHIAPEPCFDEVCVFFPDPWTKSGSNKDSPTKSGSGKDEHRRIIRPHTLDLLSERLRPGGCLHVATDVDEYAEHVRNVVASDARWSAAPPLAWRPETMYERRGLDRGRTITDLSFVLREPK